MNYGFDFEKLEYEINKEVDAEIKRLFKKSKNKKEPIFNVHKELKQGYHNQLIKSIIKGKDYEIAAIKMNDGNKGSYYIHDVGQPPRRTTGKELNEEWGHALKSDFNIDGTKKLSTEIDNKLKKHGKLEMSDTVYITKIDDKPRGRSVDPKMLTASKPKRTRSVKNKKIEEQPKINKYDDARQALNTKYTAFIEPKNKIIEEISSKAIIY